MKSSGIVGLVGGILLLICPFVLLGTAVNTAATTLNGGATAGAFSGVRESDFHQSRHQPD
ncbi:integral membrane protein [Streptococcus pneumoniae]|nr:integral membrane protein [Streptococcus pneumoniae]